MRKFKRGLALMLLLALSIGLIACNTETKSANNADNENVVYRINKIVERNEYKESVLGWEYEETVYTLQYDRNGNPVQYEIVNENEDVEDVITFNMEYSDNGLLQCVKERIGEVDSVGEIRYSYDGKGNITKSQACIYDSQGHYATLGSTEYYYNAKDNSCGKHVKDENGNTYEIVYMDADGKILREIDLGDDGAVAYQTRYYYDNMGNKTAEIARSWNGYPHTIIEYKYTYGENGELLEEETLQDSLLGTTASSSYHKKTTYSYTYDRNGNITEENRKDTEVSPITGEDLQQKGEMKITYDQTGNVTQKITVSYLSEPEYALIKIEEIMEYDDNGNLLSEKRQKTVYVRGENEWVEDTKQIEYEREYYYEVVKLSDGDWFDYYEKIIRRMLSTEGWNVAITP